MIKTSKFKKIIAFLMLMILFITNATPIFAASGSGRYAGGQYASYMKTTDNANTQYGIIIRYLIDLNTMEKKTVFCAEHGVEFATSTAYNGEYYTPSNSTIKKACKVAYLGWYSQYGDYAVDGGITASDMKWVKQDYVFTQQYIWEVLGQSSATFIDGSVQADYENFKNNIENQIADMERRPSFDGATITVQAGESKTISDDYGVFSKYESVNRTQDGITFTHNKGENTLTISVDENTTLENYNISDSTFKSWGLIREDTQDNDTMIYFEFRDGVQNQLYSMHYNDPISFRMSLKIEAFGKIELQKLNTNGDLVNGAVFNVRGPNDYNKDVEVTNGKITIEKLKKGTYTIVEKSVPYGYLIDTKAYDVEVKVNQTATQAVVNTEPTGEVKVYKTDDYNNKLKDAEISLYAKEDIKNVAGTITWHKKGDLITKATTNADGMVTFTNLHIGHYYVKETNAPDGYLLNTKEFDAELKYKDELTKVIYLNVEGVIDEEPTGSITIIKKDSKTGSVPQGDAIFTGAVYKVYAKEDIYNKARTKKFYSNGDLVATRTMDEKGKTEDITELPLGKYVVKEDRASLGYMLDTKEYEVNLVYKDQNTPVISNTTTSLEKVKEMGVHVFKSGIKVNSGETPGLEGAEFTIKLNSAVEKAYEQGYTYAEVWNGIDENGNKVNVNSQRVSEAQVIAPTYEVIKTDKDGNAYTQKNLPYGKFIVKETKTPTDYETAVDFTFSITDDETEIQEIPKKTKHIVVNNEQLESYIKIVKKDLKTGKNVTLNSTTFEIKATKDIYDRATKKILFKKGEAISQKIGNTTYTSFTTNADNIVVPDNSFNTENDNKAEVTTPLKLPVGSYEITEIRVPNGFLQLDKPVTFEIKNIKDYDTDKDGDFIKEVVVKNEQPTGRILLDKEIAIRENVDTSLIDTSDLSGIEFKLIAKEDIIDMADGSKIYTKGQEINKYNLTKDGKLTISELPMGTYEIEETKTLDGLVLNRDKYEVKFTQKDLVTKVYDEQLNISNDTTLFDFSKTDVTGDKELPGAKLTITDKEGNVVDEWTSTENKHTIEGLVIGKEYIMTEVIAPDGYVKATSISFKVEDTKEVQHVQMKDKIVDMTKTDIGGEEIEGAEIKVFDEEGNIIDEWTSSKEPHKINGLEEGKKYVLHEEVAPDGYVKATDIGFEVTTDKENQHIDLIDKIVEISKEDIAGEEIEGAKLQVLDKDNNVIEEWTSTKEPHKVTGLTEGETYKLHEEVAIGDYVKASDVEFKVTLEKETQKVVMIDKLVEIVKTDLVTGEEIEGAELQIVDEEGNIIDEWTSTKEPHKVPGLEEGKKYTLIEKTAPYGYELTEKIEFEVTTDKETQKVEMKDMPILKNIKINKVDSETKETIKEKFSFGIYRDSECSDLIAEIEANKEDGFVIFKDLRYGTYYIKETKAPKGYELSEKIVKVEINDKGIFVDDTLVEETDNTITFDFEDKLIPTPKTGDNSYLRLAFGIVLLAVLGLVWIIIKFFKGKKN
ncbi:MAG: hypothetical protein IKG14_04390 [Clostridia bacterium]|nr:hypothetical protein [Clostridia bacterium]